MICPVVNALQQQEHKPVLLEEVIGYLRCAPGKSFVDGTVGGGGHARAILEKTAPDGRLIGIDWDGKALVKASSNLQSYQDRLVLVRENFARIGSVLARLQVQEVDGILLDLGLSSFQVDEAERGFSFNLAGPLDMRMDTREKSTAAHLVNTLSEDKLAQIIWNFGEERWHRRIARHIVRARDEEAIGTTDRLARVVYRAIPANKRPRQHHPATRTFQALRLAVNRELDHLQTFLQGALNWLRPGGRLAIISFHSLEDRLVKQTFATWARSCRCPTSSPICQCEGRPLAMLVNKKPVVPGKSEIRANPRASIFLISSFSRCIPS
ncbi:MAG: 16S rRNA (cytosine(1402)-N(4))-methyltransferase RsmH, partial [Deltaproteobacteria bacterium]